MFGTDYLTAAKNFNGLLVLYPFSKYAEQAALDIIYADYMSENYTSTVADTDRYIHLYPRSQYVDYAYYMKGLADFQQNWDFFNKYFGVKIAKRDLLAAHTAFYDFKILLLRFPASQYAADARQRMIFLRNIFAAHEIQVAEYYLQRSAYVAAANRANYVIERYQGTPQVLSAFAILRITNTELGLPVAAAQAGQALSLNQRRALAAIPGAQPLYPIPGMTQQTTHTPGADKFKQVPIPPKKNAATYQALRDIAG